MSFIVEPVAATAVRTSTLPRPRVNHTHWPFTSHVLRTMGGACSSQPVNPVPQDDAPPPPAPDANDGANAANSSDAAADAGVVTADEQAFLDAEAAGIDVQSEDVLDEDVFSDEEAEFGEVEEDNKDGVDDTEALTFGVQDVEGENFMVRARAGVTSWWDTSLAVYQCSLRRLGSVSSWGSCRRMPRRGCPHVPACACRRWAVSTHPCRPKPCQRTQASL